MEYGAGTGVFTRYLLNHMTPNSRLIAIERNEGMFEGLSRRVKDPRLSVHNESAEVVHSLLAKHQIASADYIISGIPFSLFPDELTESIISTTAAALTTNGEFLVYQCLWTTKQPLIVEELKSNFAELQTQSIPFNIPPLMVYCAKRPLKSRATSA